LKNSRKSEVYIEKLKAALGLCALFVSNKKVFRLMTKDF